MVTVTPRDYRPHRSGRGLHLREKMDEPRMVGAYDNLHGATGRATWQQRTQIAI